MCGISGIFHFDRTSPVDDLALDRMRSVMQHRGPDDHGYYTCGHVGLAFNRLSIIDVAGGHQPMSNEDGTVWIIFNGEIYNFAELRQELLRRGHRFRTRSDTETIVHAWEEWGERTVSKLRGMFAFVIWDVRRQLLFGARDRLGIKPFYYHADGRRFAFASEIKSLLEVPGVPRELDTASVAEFLRRRYVVAPHTMLRGVRKLEPGHTISVTENGFRVQRYWDVPGGPEREIREEEALEQAGSLDRRIPAHASGLGCSFGSVPFRRRGFQLRGRADGQARGGGYQDLFDRLRQRRERAGLRAHRGPAFSYGPPRVAPHFGRISGHSAENRLAHG